MSEAGRHDRNLAVENRQLDQLLLQIVDVGLAGCIFLVPLMMGGRQALGQLALVTLAVAVAVVWMIRETLREQSCWRHSHTVWLLAAGVALLALQLVPLPAGLLSWLAPKTTELLPLWSGEADPAAAMGTWSCISLTPAATRSALPLFLAYGLLFVVTLQRIRGPEDVERFLRWIALSAVMMAGFGLLQLLAGNGKFFWFYEHPFSDTFDVAKGSFTNRNHFAHFLALGVGPLIWWLQQGLAEKRRRGGSFDRSTGKLHGSTGELHGGQQASVYRSVALGVVLFAGLLSLSRGGVVAIFVAAAVVVAVCYRAKTLGRRFVLSLAAAGILIGGLLTIHGYEMVSTRLDSLRSGSIETIDGQGARRTIWATVAKAIPDYALMGAGVGSHVEVYPMYLEESPGTEFTHAESGPLQVLLESGVTGLVLVVIGIGFCAFWCIDGLRIAPSPRTLVCIGAIAASLAVNLLHSVADFVWYVPACTAIVAILSGCACRMWQLSAAKLGRQAKQIKPIVLPKTVAAMAVLLLLAVGTWMITGRIGPALAEPHWNRYRIMELAAAHRKPDPQQQAATAAYQIDEASLGEVTRMIAALENVVSRDPDHARAHLRLAAVYLRRFELLQQGAENAMPLAQIRDAASQARSAARGRQELCEAEDWLTRTISEHRGQLIRALQHTRQGLALCPLQGEGYLYIAELRFLEGPGFDQSQPAYVDQALAVRPYDGAVLFEAGRAAWEAGEPQLWLDFWQRSFRSGPMHRRRMMQSLAGRLPAAFILEQFEPDIHSTRHLHARLRELNRPDQLETVGRHLARLAQVEAARLEGDESIRHWRESLWIYNDMHDWPNALACARTACRHHANSYALRYGLAQCLIRHEQFAEAETQLDWCLGRRPADEKLRRLARDVIKKRLAGEGPVMQAERPAGPLR